MRVLMVNDMLYGGGAEQVMHILGNFLEHGGFEVYYYVGSKNSLALPKKCGNIYSVPSDPLYFQNYLIWGVNPLLGFHLNKVIAQIKPDIIHCHNISGMGLSAILLSLKYDIPCVVTVHDYWPVCPNRLLLRKDNEICNVDWNYCLNGCISFTEKINLNPLLKGVFMKAMQRRAHMLSKVKLVAVSNYVKRMLKRAIPDSKVEVIHNGVNESEFPQKQPRNMGTIVLYVGGTRRFKGIDHFLQCADFLRKKGIKNEFALTQMTEFFESDGVLNFGRLNRSNLLDLYEKAVCVVVPSLWPEAHGLSVVEAMASYKPVVAYRMGGISESVADGRSGFLVKRGNIQELSDRVLFLIENPEIAIKMGCAARRIVKEKFTAKRMYEKYIHVYEEARHTMREKSDNKTAIALNLSHS